MSMIRGSALVVVTLVLIAACAPPAGPRFAFKHSERRGQFPNGLKFVLMPDATTQQLEVDVRYEVGSREDPDGKAGLAHLVEHLMFQQRPDGPSSPPLMQSITDLATGFNAYTNWDKTHYMMTGRGETLDALLKIEAIRMFYGCQTITPAEFEREREVVRNEIRQRLGTPEGQIPQLLLSAVYPRGHAYGRMIGGDDRQLTSIGLADACDFIARYYAPERATVIVAGGFDVDAAVAALDKWFAKIARRSAAPRAPVAVADAPRGRVEHALDVEHPSVHVVWPLPSANTPDGDAVRFGLFSTLARIAIKADEYEFALEVEPQMLGGDLAPVFVISIVLKDAGKLDQALAFVEKAARSAHRGFDQADRRSIEEFQNRRKAAFIAGLEPLEARTNIVGDLIERGDVAFDSSELYVFHELDKFGKFDGAQVAAAIQKYLAFDRAKIVVIRSSRAGGHGDPRSSVTFQTRSDDHMAPAEVDPKDAYRPIKLSAEPSGLAAARRIALDNGLQVVLLPIKAMPLVSARLIFNNAGTAAAPDSPALAQAAASLLSLPMDAEVFDRSGVEVGCAASLDATVCDSAGMSIYQDVVVRGLERLIAAGTYSQPQIERVQTHMRGRFGQRQREEAELRRQLVGALYGADHPYAKTGLITPKAMDRVHLDAVNEFRRRHYVAGNATLVVVGDFDPDATAGLIRSSFGGWDRGTADRPIDPALRPRSAPEVIGVAGSESPQLRVVIAYPAPAGVDGQAGARAVLAEMLNLRVGDVRFKLGSTYGVYARHTTTRGPTAYEIGGSVDAERAGESLRAMRDGVAMLRKADHFDEDFVRARRSLVSRLLGESTVTSELAERLGFIAIHGLAPDFYRQLLQQIAAVSPAQVQALIKQELLPGREIVVVLGDRGHLERALGDAGITGARIVEPSE
jgi:zinc protease